MPFIDIMNSNHVCMNQLQTSHGSGEHHSNIELRAIWPKFEAIAIAAMNAGSVGLSIKQTCALLALGIPPVVYSGCKALLGTMVK